MRVYSERLHKSLTMHARAVFAVSCVRGALRRRRNAFQRHAPPALRAHALHLRKRLRGAQQQQPRGAARARRRAVLASGHRLPATSSHLCYAPSASSRAVRIAPRRAELFRGRRSAPVQLCQRAASVRAATQASPVATAIDACDRRLLNERTPVRIFPSDAANERITWLSLSDTFLYQYGGSILERRRTVLEVGRAAPRRSPELKHINDLYRLDCAIIDPRGAQVEPRVALSPAGRPPAAHRDQRRRHRGHAARQAHRGARARSGVALLRRRARRSDRAPLHHAAHGGRGLCARQPERILQPVHARTRARHDRAAARKTQSTPPTTAGRSFTTSPRLPSTRPSRWSRWARASS